MFPLLKFTPYFSTIINGNEAFPHFRCKIKIYPHGSGTIISVEAVNAPFDSICVHIKNELFTVKTVGGYGFCAVYSPLPHYSFSDKFISINYNETTIADSK